MISEDRNVLAKILWTDEATFHSNGGVNLHNMHYWSRDNPHWMREVQHQGRWSVNVWCGILDGRIIGPYIFNESLTGLNYLNFLNNELPVLLEDVTLDIRRSMLFQHDGCPAHFAVNVRQFLDERFPARWIGRGSIFPWPARYYIIWRRLKS